MKLKGRVKPISYIKNHAAELLREITETRQNLIITQHGEAVAVLQDVEAYERTQETLALLKILALGNQQIEAGKVEPARDVIKRIRNNRAKS